MENSTRFDLNGAIQAWRDQLKGSPALKTENIDELEGHLRDSTSRLCASGLSEKEAFLIARQRLGGFEELEQEYGKVHREPTRNPQVSWMWLGAFALGAAGVLTGAISLVVSSFLEGWGFLPQGGAAGVLARWGFCGGAAIALWWGIRRVLPQFHFASIGQRPAVVAVSLAVAGLFLMLPILATPLNISAPYSPGSLPANFSSIPFHALVVLAFATMAVALLNRRAFAGLAAIGLAGIFLLTVAPMWTMQWMAASQHPHGPSPASISGSPFYQLLPFLILAAVVFGALRRSFFGAFAIFGLVSILLLMTVPSLVARWPASGSYPFRSSPEFYPGSLIVSLFLFLVVSAVVGGLLRRDRPTEIKSA